MGVVRKLEDILPELGSLIEQGNVEGFFNNVKNADKLDDLVEDTRDATMDYRVCIYELLISGASDIRTRLQYSKISTTRVVSLL